MKIRSNFWALCLVTFGLSSVFAQVKNPLDIAATYLEEHASELGLKPQDVSQYRLSSQHVSQHNQLTHVYLEQTWAGIPVANAIFNLNITAQGDILYVGNRFLRNLGERINTTQARLNAQQAIQAFSQQMRLPVVSKWQLMETTPEGVFIFDPQGQALEPVRAQLIYQPLADKTVRLAWQISYYPLDAQHWWLAVVDAVSGELIDLFDQVVHCDFDHSDDCDEEHVHLATHDSYIDTAFDPTPSGLEDGLSYYKALPLTVESPNHGSRQRVQGPANAVASPFGWHDTDGLEGADFTITRGNNVHAYQDILNQNTSLGDEPDGGDSLVFDFPMALDSNRPYTYRDALVTNLFYWNNLMHDLWYNYGFDEAAGNFQETNYAEAGDGGDYVQAEALDGSGTNNANFATPTDGQRPRMQMYLWGGSLQSSGRELIARTAQGDTRSYEFVQFAFGGDLPSAETPLTAQGVLVDDAEDNPADACEPIVNTDELVGKTALIDRGDCEFGFKALAAQQAGAIAVIICNNENTPIFEGGPGAVGDQVSIPAIMLSRSDCNELKMLLEDGPVEISLFDQPITIPDPGPSGRSSDLDNGIIAHEYGHGISIRLTAGRNNNSCLRNVEQAGEGWSDWFGMVMATTPEMTADQRRGVGTYAGNQPTNGRGIRNYPYSRSMNVNPHTYADINSVSVPHGVGSVWCAMIWDLYWNLIDEYGYDEDLYNGTGGNNMAMQLVIDGLKIQPCNPSFIESRDAILAADEANYDGANRCLIWETFARRGLGVSAQEGGVEAFDTPITCLNAFVVQKTAVSEAFAGESITYDLQIVNGKSVAIDAPVLYDTLPAGVRLIPESVSCPFTLEGNVIRFELDDLPTGTVTNCSYTVETNQEDFSYVAFFDGLEGGLGNFVTEVDLGEGFWRRWLNDAYEGRFSWYSQNSEEASDHSLITIPLALPAGERPGLSFYHRFTTEEEWDGGVVEMTLDAGQTWIDLADYMIKGRYTGRLNESDSNPLSGRRAFTGSTGGDWIETIIDLEAFAGEEVQFRFRYGTDEGTAEEGWYIDNVTLFGNLFSLSNVVCAQDEESEYCSTVTTVIFAMPTSTEEVLADLPLQVFPNPASARLQVRFGAELQGEVQLDLLNVAGQRVLAQQFGASPQLELDVSRLPAGIYFLQVQTEQGHATRKVVVR